jgi:hypothetical protein
MVQELAAETGRAANKMNAALMGVGAYALMCALLAQTQTLPF